MITTATDPCWVVRPVDRDELDYEPHFDDELRARDALERTSERHGVSVADLVVLRETAPCATAACDGCGYKYDESGEGVEHWPDATELAGILADFEWSVGERLLCSECAPAAAQDERESTAGDRP